MQYTRLVPFFSASVQQWSKNIGSIALNSSFLPLPWPYSSRERPLNTVFTLYSELYSPAVGAS